MAGSGRSRRKFSAERRLAFCVALLAANSTSADGVRTMPYDVVGDAIPAPLSGSAGDPARGRAIVVDRRTGLCLLCHSGPFPEARLQGTLAPDLGGVGARLSTAQLRLRLVDASRLNPNTIMPPYYRTEDLNRAARAYAGKPVLSAEQVEDVVAFLATLKE